MTVVAKLVSNRFPAIIAKMPQLANRIVEETVEEIDTEIRTQMAAAKSGRWYGDHQASAPGEAPAIDTGELLASLQTEVDGGKGAVYTNAEHAVYMEYGAPGANIAPRPFMTPAAEVARPNFMRRVKNLEKDL